MDTRIKIDSRLKTVHSLTIDNSNLSDAAKYSLRAKNESGEAIESCNLIVQSKPYFLNLL